MEPVTIITYGLWAGIMAYYIGRDDGRNEACRSLSDESDASSPPFEFIDEYGGYIEDGVYKRWSP